MQPLRCLLTFAKLTAGLRWFLVGGGRFTPGHAKVRCEEWPVSLPCGGRRGWDSGPRLSLWQRDFRKEQAWGLRI